MLSVLSSDSNVASAISLSHAARMSLGQRIRQARERSGINQSELARRVGVSRSAATQWEGDGTEPSAENLRKIADAARVSYEWLATGKDMPLMARMVPVVGYVGAGAAAVLFSDGQGPFDEVDAPEGSTDKTVAVQIKGESLGALFDRWLVFYDDVRDPPGGRQIGRLCVCGLADGRILVKKLTRGQLPGHFTLLSNVEPPIYDAIVEWAAEVKTMVPR